MILIKNLLFLILILFSALSCSEIIEPYWETHKSVWDPKLNQNRCVDESGQIMDMEPPCLSLTVAGRHAVQKKEKNWREKPQTLLMKNFWQNFLKILKKRAL